ncbi:MAG: penicillin acylase family protein [Acidimicrobiales bacterium]|nr:penicillin acylase family protein [Acidimicrobiales bacterium]
MTRRLLALLIVVAGLAAVAPLADAQAVADAPAAESEAILDVGGTPVRIIRTDYGVPHVYADETRALFHGVGFVTAQDRLWQAEVFRRAAAGRLAEIGVGSAEDDLFTRQDGYTDQELQAMYAALEPEAQQILDGYVSGINAYLAEATASAEARSRMLPLEYAALGVEPAPWTVADVMRAAVYFVRRFGETGGRDLDNLAVLQDLVARFGEQDGWARFDDLLWIDDPDAYATAPGELDLAAAPVLDAPPPAAPLSEEAKATGLALPDVRAAAARLDAQRGSWRDTLDALGVPTKGGSNTIVIGPTMSEDGSALLLGGPQMGYTVPQIVLEVGIHGAGFDSEGMTFAGVSPFPLIGRGRDFAWSSTTGSTDVVDHVIEQLEPGNPTRYLYQGEYRDMEARTEVIQVRGSAPLTATVYRTVHGPVVDVDPATDTAVSVQRTFWKGELDSIFGFLAFNRATGPDDFRAGAAVIPSNHNFTYADAEGRIGYWMTGRFPIRPAGVDPRLPRLGTGEQEWQGLVNITDLVDSVDPDQGYFVNWNNKPIAGWPNGDIGPAFGPTQRVGLLDALVRGQAPISRSDLLEINREAATTDLDGFNFRQLLLDAIARFRASGGSLSSLASRALDLVAAWDDRLTDADGDGRYDAPGVTVLRTWVALLEVPLLEGLDDPDVELAADGVLWRLLVGPDGAALAVRHAWFGGRSIEQAVADALDGAVRALEVLGGGAPPDRWLTPVRLTTYTPLGALPGIERRFLNRGTYNQVLELAPGRVSAVNVVPPGQSGLVTAAGTAAHTDDQLELYDDFRYKAQFLDVRAAPVRLAGGDRYATAAAVSAAAFAPGVPVAFVTSGEGFADAITGQVAAARGGGPLLLVRPGEVPATTADELTRLRPGRIVVLGGTAAVSDAVLGELRGFTGGEVTRVAGSDRYATAAAVSAATFPDGAPVAFVATGTSFADALTGGVAAARGGGPVLLVEPGAVPDVVLQELIRLAPEQIVVLGGPAAVSEAVASELTATAPVRRVSGADRYATSAAVAEAFFSAPATGVWVATGEGFADALTGGVPAALRGGPMLLTRRTTLPDPVWDELAALQPAVATVIGGSRAVDPAVASELESALRR